MQHTCSRGDRGRQRTVPCLPQEEFSAISFLIGALIDEGPVQGISALENAPQILERFLFLTADYRLNSEDLEVILAVRRMMGWDDE